MKNSTIERAKERAAVQYRVKQSFIGRNYYLFYGVCVVWVVASLWSAATASGNIYIRTSGMFGEGWVAAIAAILAGVTLVGLQFISGKGAVDDLQVGIINKDKQGEWRYAFSDRAFFFLKSLAFVFVTSVSITLSLNGVATANDWFRNDRRPFQAAQADVSFYDAEIARIQGSIEQEKTRKWKGVLTTDASRRIAKYEAQKAKVIEQRQTAIAAVDAINSEAKSRYDKRTKSNAALLQGFGGVAEVVIIFCVIFIGLYDDGLYREARVKSGPSAPQAFTPPVGFNRAPAFGQSDERAYRDTDIGFTVRNSVAQQSPRPVAQQAQYSPPVQVRNSVATSQQKAQQSKRNKNATNAQYLSARSAIRNARSAIKKAQQQYEAGAIDADQMGAIIATKQAAIDRNEKRAAKIKNGKS